MGSVADAQVKQTLEVSFFPPLHLQRRLWVLNILRREGVTSIIDVGCGEGELLATLCQPAPWLSPDLPSPAAMRQEDPVNLHLANVAGLDVSSRDLRYAVEFTTPSAHCPYERWEPLDVKIWKGGLEAFNAEFVDAECIVSTEVVEHLPEDILAEFGPVLLGLYQPRLFLITTPSYDFNARFSPPDIERPEGYPDPTGRTSRIFRHHDHKFEWTVVEFTEWCQGVASEWGYSVDVGAIGKALERDEWGRDEELGGASQVAEFRRLDDERSVQMRAKKREIVQERAAGRIKHELLATHHYAAHPSSKKPRSLTEIGRAIVAQFEEVGEVVLRLQEIWFMGEIGVLCGGRLEAMVEAIEESPKLRLQKDEWNKRGEWKVELAGSTQRHKVAWSSENSDNDINDTWTQDDNEREGNQETEEVGWKFRKPSWDSGVDLGEGEAASWDTDESAWRANSGENKSSWAGSWGDSTVNVWENGSDEEKAE
ncbi:hypothetical protein BV22DRAFT_1009925 [Leucogyrophana mollusca]|uniref:Uncharacterized protein n=1 Tax=Leucogyrophana mollusca TaxID=85980 RepID=A0ACB8BMJ7_9AGAM|nr:hypothetical protein BV22DRAFT_1009925 [Leucogyrophana mollusca]